MVATEPITRAASPTAATRFSGSRFGSRAGTTTVAPGLDLAVSEQDAR